MLVYTTFLSIAVPLWYWESGPECRPGPVGRIAELGQWVVL